MALIAGLDEDVKGVTGDSVTVHRPAPVIAWAGQVAINTVDIGVNVNGMRRILGLILVTTGTESIRRRYCPCLLGMDFVTIDAGHTNHTVAARPPFEQGAGMAASAQIRGGSNGHTFLGMLGPIGTVAGFTGYAGQHKLARGGIIASGVASEAFVRLFYLLQINLENWVK